MPIIATALITGATRVSNEMNDAVSESVSDENQSPKVLLGKIASTLRSGAIAAGKDMMTNGLESIKKKPGITRPVLCHDERTSESLYSWHECH